MKSFIIVPNWLAFLFVLTLLIFGFCTIFMMYKYNYAIMDSCPACPNLSNKDKYKYL